MSHINLLDLDVSKLKLAKSGRSIKIIYDKEPLQIVTGKLYTPFGVKIASNNYSAFSTCYIDCSLNQSTSETSIKYSELLETLDNKIIDLIKDSLHLFNTGNLNFEPEDIANIYSPMLRNNKTFPKLMKLMLSRDSRGNFESVIFNENKEKIIINENSLEDVLCKGKIFKTIIECNKIWYYNGRFGTTWNIKQLKFVNNIPIDENTTENNTNTNNNIYQNIMILDD